MLTILLVTSGVGGVTGGGLEAVGGVLGRSMTAMLYYRESLQESR